MKEFNFLEKIKHYQVRNNLTNTLLAKEIGICQVAISQWNSKRRKSLPHPITVKIMVEKNILSIDDAKKIAIERNNRVLEKRKKRLNNSLNN